VHDFAVIGGGIVGLSVAWQLRRRQPTRRIVVLEKEPAVARHQTGHNSGVIHAGIYYEPGSLKAELCRKGVTETLRFCRDNEIPYEQCGKLIVATSDVEYERMLALCERALQNGIRVELLDEAQLRPSCRQARESSIMGPCLPPWASDWRNSAANSAPVPKSRRSRSLPTR
jgi:L-2-hydroxyglutarate oxidase